MYVGLYSSGGEGRASGEVIHYTDIHNSLLSLCR